MPEVVDPLNIRAELSSAYEQSGDDYVIHGTDTSTVTTESEDQNGFGPEKTGLKIVPSKDLKSVSATLFPGTDSGLTAYILDSSDSVIASKSFSGDSFTIEEPLSAGTSYYVVVDKNGSSYSYSAYGSATSYPYESKYVDITTAYNGDFSPPEYSNKVYSIKSITATKAPDLSGKITGRFSAPTAAPADFSQWEAVQARGVSPGGSTATEAVEFDILDSSDAAVNSARIPASEMADSAFKFRDREASVDASADGQSDFVIPTTGSGGHYGIPILSVVSVSKNGSPVPPENWEFDGAETVSVDTSAVSITSGDSVTISYDLDVFDATLQPRAYLNRADSSEDSPSISHFRYEYVI
ncbi:hypothetical protein ACOZ4L_05725 [Haloplanus ruber]|uniref:Uncharacterized protein n=1 Tax=Haloplanus ruber TaxID=869892 RepID=A0ABD6CTV7_9EURY|nr:hypothetical protein [Haloplanus ruber]